MGSDLVRAGDEWIRVLTARSTALRTQQEVADVLGISRARVMQLEQSALRKIRRALGVDATGEDLAACRRLVNGAQGDAARAAKAIGMPVVRGVR